MVLRDGAPVFDRLGRWFTLVCVGFAPGDALPAAAARRGLPLAVLRLDDPEVAKVYGRGLLLVRPDQHIAWRGPACDDSRAADVVMARVLGWKRSGSVRIAQPPSGLLGTLRRLHNSGGGPGLANAPCWSLLIPPDGCVLGRSSE